MRRGKRKEHQQFGLPDVGIPAEVLFNPELTSTQKILFGFIRNLSHSSKGCWASNKYLAQLVDAKGQTVTNAVTKLKELNYIVVEYHTIPSGMQGRVIFVNKMYPQIYSKYIEQVYKNFNDPL